MSKTADVDYWLNEKTCTQTSTGSIKLMVSAADYLQQGKNPDNVEHIQG